MPSLAELQADFRQAVAARNAHVPATVVAPVAAGARLAIYRRHYREALVRHLAGRFPTVEWLLGTPGFLAIADDHVRNAPPKAPCMAEYGSGFIDALRSNPEIAAAVPYALDVARLDWALGTVAVAIDEAALDIGGLASWPPERLPDLRLRLQPGLAYVEAAWPVDDLVRIRLSDGVPDPLHFTAAAVAFEVRGARGQFRIGRLDLPELKFRSSLAAGDALGSAIGAALSIDPDFAVSAALAAVFSEGLVVEIQSPIEE